MSLIITATDFSEVAGNEVNYACRLALHHNAGVAVIHSFMMPVMFSDVPMPGSLVNDSQKHAEAQMNDLLTELALRYPGLALTGKVIYGDTIDVLEAYKEENIDPWMVVIGNSSLAQNNSWPDSILIDALKALKYPVLAVPPGAVFSPVHNLCFAMDNKQDGYETAILKLTDITLRLNAGLHIINVGTASGSNADHTFDEHLKEQLSKLNPVYHFADHAADIDDAILSFAEKNGMDWLVVMPRKHSLFEALLHKSHTRALAHHSHIPILAIHEHHK